MSREIFGISTGFLGAAIVSLRKALGDWSQEKLARKLGCSSAAVRQWERGRRHPSLLAIQKMVALCPDDKTRKLFSNPAPVNELEVDDTEPETIRALRPELRQIRRDFKRMLGRLRELDQLGNPVAREYLREILDSLARAAAIATTSDEPKNRRAGLLSEEVRNLRRRDG